MQPSWRVGSGSPSLARWLALNANGFRRGTDNINVLINREDAAKVVHTITNRDSDWEPYYRGTRRRFHDVVRDVPVDFWLSGYHSRSRSRASHG